MPRARANGIDLHYESFGSGEPLILIVGVGAQMIQWDDDFCVALAARGFRVIRFDNRDVGESQILHHLGLPDFRRMLLRRSLGLRATAPYTLDDMADDTLGLLDALRIERAHVVGMSLGGMVAQCLALRYPARVASLCLLMSTPGELWACLPTPKMLLALGVRAGDGEAGAVQYQLDMFRLISSRPHHTPEASLRRIATLHYRRGLHPSGFARQLAAVLGSPGRLRRLRDVRAPTLVIHGARDPVIPPFAGRLTAARIPGARLAVIRNMGHDLGPSLWPYVIDAIADNTRRTLSADTRPMGFARALRARTIRVHTRSSTTQAAPSSCSRG
jgi:pimeloyl-ACP methyl ester carboxylesterase